MFTAVRKLHTVFVDFDTSKSQICLRTQSTLEKATGSCIDNNEGWTEAAKEPLENIHSELAAVLSNNMTEVKNLSSTHVIKSPKSIANGRFPFLSELFHPTSTGNAISAPRFVSFA
ncbi:hypothetical protein DdX_16485 [Ditylenchus destructor]|uniref:Uncharacterized protein n=1 Tax=Ditylenchus destructor TaxID=166010 RepID=A0AAD4MNB6_9BILA|nr:hypothetical protein DdX_16485 [Ditylenchus destructor]